MMMLMLMMLMIMMIIMMMTMKVHDSKNEAPSRAAHVMRALLAAAVRRRSLVMRRRSNNTDEECGACFGPEALRDETGTFVTCDEQTKTIGRSARFIHWQSRCRIWQQW